MPENNATVGNRHKKFPIVIVPGIMGTRLTDPATGALVWNPTGMLPSEPGSFAANTNRLMQVDQALVPDETHPFKDPKKHAEVAPIRRYYNVITSFYGKLARRMHYNLRPKLAAKGLVPVVYCCGYDFRVDNAVSAGRLASVVAEAQKECEGAPVTIIAHSMGGLVTRHFCKNLGGEAKVRRVFLLGSPTLGSPKAYFGLREGLPLFDAVRIVLTPFGTAKKVMRRMPAVYQLLPTFLYGKRETQWLRFSPEQTGIDPIAPRKQIPALMFKDCSNNVLVLNDIYTGITDDLEFRTLSRGHYATALKFEGGLQVGAAAAHTYMHPSTIAVVCDNLPTDGEAFVRFITAEPKGSDMVVRSSLQQIRQVMGDETVPIVSAAPAEAQPPIGEIVPFGNASHQDMPNHALVIDFLLDKIESLA